MQDLFGGVVYAGIDTDKHKYPIGKMLFHLKINAISVPYTRFSAYCRHTGSIEVIKQ